GARQPVLVAAEEPREYEQDRLLDHLAPKGIAGEAPATQQMPFDVAKARLDLCPLGGRIDAAEDVTRIEREQHQVRGEAKKRRTRLAQLLQVLTVIGFVRLYPQS